MLLNRVILLKCDVFGEYFVNKSETKKMVERKFVLLNVSYHPLYYGP